MPFRALATLAALLVLSTAAAAATPADATLQALVRDDWAWRQAHPAGLDEDVEHGPSAHLPQVGPDAQAARLAHVTQVRSALAHIPRAQLSPTAQTDYDVLVYQLESMADGLRLGDWQAPVNSDSAFWTDMVEVARQPFKSEAEVRRYLSRLADTPAFMQAEIADMRLGAARGFTAPRVTLEGRDVAIAATAEARRPEDTPFYAPFATLPASIPAAEQAQLKAEGSAVIRDKVMPPFRDLLAFWRTDYFPHTRTTIAAEALPDGRAYYQAQIYGYTTTRMSPDAIHAFGLSEMARIRAEMEDARRESGFTGDLPAFLKFLRTDPRFYAKTPDELLKDAAWIAKTFDAKVSLYFGHPPRARFAIKPVPPDQAPFYTAGRGGPGVYLVNTYDLPSRPLYSLTALTLHESAPGHAFQIPLAEERKDLPEFRRKSYISAYGEGWAVYCERLGTEMGMYPTPYDRFGMLSYQAWRAARLVVDTGIHHLGWSREQARQYLRDNTALSEHEIDTEVDRYISWPGQALSYYLGEAAIWKARHKAEAALGPKFNIRAFHDAVLETGSVPLATLEARVDRFIADGGRGPYPDEEE
ncbi:MAG: DUF885 family protein [Caulobacteraceae bacterium]|nr:DUF885 family protein [Caulobacter sp.]